MSPVRAVTPRTPALHGHALNWPPRPPRDSDARHYDEAQDERACGNPFDLEMPHPPLFKAHTGNGTHGQPGRAESSPR